MKKVIAILLLVCVFFSGCSMLRKADVTEKAFSIDSYDLQLTADSTFYENTGGSFDLQITNDKAYVSIMAYRYIDLPEGITPRDVYDTQTEDLFSRRTAVTVIEETEELSQNITGGLYSAEKDGVKNYYATYLVDLPQEETLAWVLVTATPSYLEANREYLYDIVRSLKTAE